jgi:hypothetical protein
MISARVTGYTSIAAFNPRISGIYGSVADNPTTAPMNANVKA